MEAWPHQPIRLTNAAGGPMAHFKDAPASLILPPAQEDEVIRLIEVAPFELQQNESWLFWDPYVPM